MKTLIKICGITNKNDAQAAIDLGADAAGFIFYPGSPRYVPVHKAREICSDLRGNIKKIGVFVNENRSTLDSLYIDNWLDYFQFSGDETPAMCSHYAHRAIKAFRINKDFKVKIVENFDSCVYYLFDTGISGCYGGSGKQFDWSIIESITRNKPIILAGGLNESNVADAVKTVKPFMVDVSTGVESCPGKKDYQKLKLFIEACRKADKNE